MNKEEQIRQNRHTHMLGEEAAAAVLSSTILIMNINNVNAECCKNLGLCGMKVHLYDPTLITKNDCAYNLFYSIEHIGQPKGKIVATRLREMNPLNKGIENLDSVQDFSKQAVCLYGVTKFCEVDLDLIEKFEQANLKQILSIPFGFGGFIYSKFIYSASLAKEDHHYLNAIKNTKNSFITPLNQFIDKSNEKSFSDCMDEIKAKDKMKGNKLKRFESLLECMSKGEGRQIVTTGSILGGQSSNEVLWLFKKDSKIANAMKFQDGLSGNQQYDLL